MKLSCSVRSGRKRVQLCLPYIRMNADAQVKARTATYGKLACLGKADARLPFLSNILVKGLGVCYNLGAEEKLKPRRGHPPAKEGSGRSQTSVLYLISSKNSKFTDIRNHMRFATIHSKQNICNSHRILLLLLRIFTSAILS